MKRVVLFLATNIAVLLVLSVVISLFGLDRWLAAEGIDYRGLLMFSAVVGFGGAIISLLMSKPMAKWSTHARVIDGSEGSTEYWLVQTVKRFADRAGIARSAVHRRPLRVHPGPFSDGARDLRPPCVRVGKPKGQHSADTQHTDGRSERPASPPFSSS